jgi:hypothetical protein
MSFPEMGYYLEGLAPIIHLPYIIIPVGVE